MENRFATPRIDSFPAGLRVLVVDDDPTWLKILEKMLKRCSYEVTTCFLARDALGMLRERKGGFDIVISDVNMPDMDGFKLLEHVGLEMNLPVIMMSVDGETSRVMKGVQHGACDYLLKPVRMKELQNIWQHVFRKKLHEVKDIESHECNEDIQKISNRLDKFDDGLLLTRSDLISTKKRKDMENQEYDDHDFSDSSAAKKARVVWSVDLHQKFVNAVDQIGFDKAGPKKILDLMNVPWLTRENVASHLQKYRLYWSRMQKQNEPKTSSGAIKQQDFTSKDPPPSFGLQSSIMMHQNDSTSCSFGFSGSKIPVPSFSPEIQENDLESIVTFLPVSESKPALTDDGPYPQKVSSGSGMSLTNSFGSLRPDVSYTSFVSNIPQNNSWGGEIPMMQFPQQPKEEPKTNGFVHLLLPGTHHDIQADKAAPSEIKPPYNESKSNHVRDLSSTGSTIDSFSVQAKIDIVNPEAFGDRSTITQLMNLKNHSFDQNFIRNWESYEQPRSGPPLVPSREALQLCSLQDYGYIENIGLNNLESLDYHDLEYITEFPSHVYDGLSFNSDSLCVSMEYPIMDQGLFIA